MSKGSTSTAAVIAAFIVGSFGAQTAVSALDAASRGTYVKSVYSLPLTLDPIQMNDTASLVAGNLIYDGLLRFSPTLALEGALAESWSTSHDGLTLTFKLRPNLHFQDGSEVTAADAVASLNRALSPQSRVASLYRSIEPRDGILAPDSRMVVIRLRHPFPPILSILAGGTAKVLPRKLVSKPGFFKSPIGSGPFRLVKQTKTELRLESVEHYAGKPKIERLVLRMTPEAQAQTMAAHGELHDLANWPLEGADPLFERGQKLQSPLAATWIIGLNTTKAPFNSLAVRQGFKAAVDTQGFRDKFFADALPAYGYVPPGLPGYVSHPSPTAKTETKGSREWIRIAIPKALARHAEMKAFFEADLKSKGWNVEVIPMEWDQLMAGYNAKKYQAFLVSMNMDYPDAEFLLRSFESGSAMNFSGLKDARIDSLLDKARTEQDRRKRQSFYQEAIERMDRAAVTVNLFHPVTNIWASKCVKGLKPNILSDVYIDYSQVSLDLSDPACSTTKTVVMQ